MNARHASSHLKTKLFQEPLACQESKSYVVKPTTGKQAEDFALTGEDSKLRIQQFMVEPVWSYALEAKYLG